MGKPWMHWIVMLQPVWCACAYRYDSWYRADMQRPVDAITDVVNELGVSILQQYSAHGNVAFSPTGVAFVLAALYEGAAGRGKQQIAEAMALPTNQDISRIGFRDINRRLRSYLNADGFLGGLTLSRENIRLRPEYEDILRFYGFDLTSIEQEANVTVSMEGSAATEPPRTTTIDSTSLPVETTNTGSVPDTTTTLADAASSTTAATTSAPSTATAATQETITTSVAADTQPTSTSGTVTESIPVQPLTTVASQSTQSSTDETETVTAPITTATSLTGPVSTSRDTQASSTVTMTMIVAGDENTQTPTIAASVVTDAGTSATAATTAGSNVENASEAAVPSASVEMPTDTTSTTSMATDVASTNSEASTETAGTTNMMNATATVADTSTEALAAASTVVGDSAATNTATSSDSLTPAAPTTTSATGTVSSTAVMDSSVISQPGTEESPTPTPAGNATAITVDVTTVSMSDAGDTAAPEGEAMTTMTTPVRATNGSSSDSDNSTITDSTTSSASMDNQTAASLMDENTISTNRKKKAVETEATESVPPSGNVMNGDTVKDESTNGGPANSHKRKARSPRGYFSSYPDEGIWMQDLDIWKSYSTLNPSDPAIGDSASEISFMVNGCDVSSVSASAYIAVLPFAYFPSLHAVALEFPLDDPRYNIILLMPTDKTDTHRLARDLSGKALRSLRKRLQPTWVRATIPSFMLRGFVTLTSFLQRLGILDVFEPRVADLSPMTADLGVYARDVQQSIGVNIRNYMKPDRTHSRNGLFERAGPVPFTALHPFLYFIVDTETSVSLIAGRVDDPLNSRIL